jgi:hypothetical protein
MNPEGNTKVYTRQIREYTTVGLPKSDLGVYVLSGAFAILVFAVAIAVLVTQTAIELRSGTVATFSVGFLLFMAVYFAAMVVYREIDEREPL